MLFLVFQLLFIILVYLHGENLSRSKSRMNTIPIQNDQGMGVLKTRSFRSDDVRKLMLCWNEGT